MGLFDHLVGADATSVRAPLLQTRNPVVSLKPSCLTGWTILSIQSQKVPLILARPYTRLPWGQSSPITSGDIYR